MDPWYRVVTPHKEVLRNLLRVEQDRGPEFIRLANALSAGPPPEKQRGEAAAGRDAAGGAAIANARPRGKR